jgi:hypothetical protein
VRISPDAAAEICRYRCVADSGKLSARQFYGFPAQLPGAAARQEARDISMSTLMIVSSLSRPFRAGGLRAFRLFPAVVLLLCASLLVALEAPSKPFLEKNNFYLSSAGFRVQLANDPAGQKAMHALPPHRFVIHRDGANVRYLFAEPVHCVCVFIGTQANYEDYRDIVGRGMEQPDYVAPDYKSQASALLYGDPYDWNSLNQPDSIADYFRAYY